MTQAIQNQIRKGKPRFIVDDYIDIKIHVDLACELGDFILTKGTDNKALFALARRLKKLEIDEDNVTEDAG